MKIKLQDYGLINVSTIDKMIKELEAFKSDDAIKNIYLNSMIGTLVSLKEQLIPAEKLADKSYDIGWERGVVDGSGFGSGVDKEKFLNSKIEIQ